MTNKNSRKCLELNQSENSKVFGAFESSKKDFFGNIFFSHKYRVIEISKFCHSNRMCEKGVESSVCKMDWTCSVGNGLVINVQKDTCFGLGLTLCTIFNIFSQFSEIAVFGKIVKIHFFKIVNVFSLFQCGVSSWWHEQNELVENLVNEKIFLKKAFLRVFFLAPETKHYWDICELHLDEQSFYATSRTPFCLCCQISVGL